MLSPYPLLENDEYSYEFTTDQGIKYDVYFLDYSPMFYEYPHIANTIFSFNIEVAKGNADQALADERIGITIVETFRLFFEKLQNVVIYVCDSIDNRQLARKRKFDAWFSKYNDGTIIKIDGVAIVEDVQILNTLLIHKYNTNAEEIITAYTSINESANDK